MNSLKLTAVAAALMLAGSAYAANAEIYPRLEHFVLGGVSYERHSSPRVSSDPRV